MATRQEEKIRIAAVAILVEFSLVLAIVVAVFAIIYRSWG